ncbi:hypothetical protein AHAS_Ahas13G0036400 [Arachis hypogaea]
MMSEEPFSSVLPPNTTITSTLVHLQDPTSNPSSNNSKPNSNQPTKKRRNLPGTPGKSDSYVTKIVDGNEPFRMLNLQQGFPEGPELAAA